MNSTVKRRGFHGVNEMREGRTIHTLDQAVFTRTRQEERTMAVGVLFEG